MRQGRIGTGVGTRIEQLLTHLQTLNEADAASIDSERFTALAGEIDWAEHVLRHTLADPSGERP
ncbi:MAG TPA: hypothetical protein DCQ06_00050 [Myxococcales bacterium]|nr:hypothetical protein [Myxococcales bacterium]